ncbi:MAG: Glu-tRNA(Gln) amidotransferase GatDE subunit D, partial [Thermoplasmata archaeon]
MSIRKEILERVGAKEGDVIRIKKEGRTYEGILMPHHEFSDENIVTIKLRNGYNIGVEVNRDTKIEILEKGKEKEKLKVKVPFDPKKKTISILGTGGTIACYVDYRTGAVHPAYSADDLAFSAPEIFDVCNVRARIVYQLLSENMEVDHWKRLA